jgi:hypothetical protein
VWQLLEGAEGDAVGLAQGAVDGAGFSHAHLGVVEDEGRDVAGVGIAVADEAAALGRLIDRGLEDPEVFLGAAQWQDGFRQDPMAVAALSQAKKASVSDVQLAFERANLAQGN